MFGIHLATAAEAMALGARAGLNVRNLFDIISTAAGSSWYTTFYRSLVEQPLNWHEMESLTPSFAMFELNLNK